MFNHDSDLLFTAAKDKSPQVWFTHNGERLGTFEGHSGAVFHMDVSFDSKYLLTASGDMTARYWDVKTGREIACFKHDTIVRSVAFSEGEEMFLAAVARTSSRNSTVFIYSLEGDDTVPSEPLRTITLNNSSTINGALWSPLNASVITAGDDGYLRLFDLEEQEIKAVQIHKKSINSIAYSKDKTMIITASADMTSKIIDARTFEVIKTFQSDRNLNGASISPILNHVIMAGGEDALDVMHSSAKQGRFEVDFWHTVFEERLASVGGHFGPVNTLSFSPNGKMFASGGEDGFVRLHHLDKTYLNSTY